MSKSIFNPFLISINDVKNFLKPGQSHPIGNNEILQINQDGTLSIKKIGNPKEYISMADFAAIEQSISDNLRRFARNICGNSVDDINQYSLTACSGNLTIRVTNKCAIGFISVNKRTYFDAVVHDDNKCLTYNNQNLKGLYHSGDIKDQSYLFHSISVTDAVEDGQKFALGACGYNKTPLHQFIGGNPVIMCFDHESKIIYIIPCPIDQASIGNSTLSFFAKITVNKNLREISLSIDLIPPQTVNNVNTGDCNPDVIRAVRTALEFVTETPVIVSSDVTIELQEPSVSDTLKSKFLQFSDSDWLPLEGFTNIPTYRGFGNKESDTSDYPKLPFQYGICEGHKSVELGEPSNISISPEIISEAYVVHNITLNGWNHFSANTNTCVGHGIFVIHLTKSELENINDLTIYPLSMMGSRALVVLECQGKFYYYRGQNMCFEEQQFGSEIPDFLEKLANWSRTPLQFPTISLKDDTSVYGNIGNIDGNLRKMELQDFLSLDMDDVYTYIATRDQELLIKDILYIMIQFQICCQPDKLNLVSAKIIQILNVEMNKTRSELKQLMNECIDNDFEKFKALTLEYKNCEEVFNTKYQAILVKLNTMVSQKGVITKKQSLQRIERKATIKSNVDAVENMSASEIFKESFDENGCIILNLNIGFIRLLQKIQDFTKVKSDTGYIDTNEFVSKIISMNDGSFACFTPSQRCLQLDADTLQTIAEVTISRKHELFGSEKCIAIPGLASESRTCLPIPISKEFMSKIPPDFKSLANHPKFAHFRIALRQTISKANSTRDLEIDESSTLLGAVIAIVFLEALEIFTKDIVTKPEEGSNVQLIIRGLLGFILTTMASGVNGQVKGWDLFDNKTSFPITMESWKIYQRIMIQARLADWITPKVLRNFNKITSVFVAELNPKEI